jgi:DNA-binding response OmpR family regulator
MTAVLKTPRAGRVAPGAVAGLPGPPSWRVLVVDDNDCCADCLAVLLRRQGHAPLVAYDGARALAAARWFRPEVVLSDLGLPGLSGLELARRLRREPGLESAYLVALTGCGEEESRRLAFEAGFDAYLTKPVSFAEVQELLEQFARETEALVS